MPAVMLHHHESSFAALFGTGRSAGRTLSLLDEPTAILGAFGADERVTRKEWDAFYDTLYDGGRDALVRASLALLAQFCRQRPLLALPALMGNRWFHALGDAARKHLGGLDSMLMPTVGRPDWTAVCARTNELTGALPVKQDDLNLALWRTMFAAEAFAALSLAAPRPLALEADLEP